MAEDIDTDEVPVEVQEQFQKLADMVRKATETHVAVMGNAAIAPALDQVQIAHAVLSGIAGALSTCMFSVATQTGAEEPETLLHDLIETMQFVWRQTAAHHARTVN